MKTTARNIREIIVEISRILLIGLWAYTAMMKFGNMEQNLDSMHKQFFPAYIGNILAYLVPIIALIAVVCLLVKLKIGFLISIGLLAVFIIYILIVFAEIFSTETCACAGIFPRLGYTFHLTFNIVMLIIALTGFILYRKQTRGDAENRYQSRQHTLFFKQHD